ncbi:MAG: hypothetical protein JJT93_13970, partial [Gammaproteobacteria bacterium]|nr:hypothetical protein [Gammaproteobacteria bacterium]
MTDRRHRHPQRPQQYRIDRLRSRTMRPAGGAGRAHEGTPPTTVSLDGGRGKLHFAPAFEDAAH